MPATGSWPTDDVIGDALFRTIIRDYLANDMQKGIIAFTFEVIYGFLLAYLHLTV